MRTSTSFATLVAFMAITSSATPVGVVGSSDRAIIHACAHEHARGLVPEGHLNPVKDVATSVGDATKNGDINNLATPDAGKSLPDASHIVDGLPAVHACVDINTHDDRPSDQSQHQEPPKDQPAPQNPQASQNESQPPKNDPQPQSSETHDDDSGATVSANMPNPEKTENGIEGVHDQVVDEAKGAIQEAQGIPAKAQNEISSVQGNIDHPDERLDVVAGVNVSVNKSQQLGQVAAKKDDTDLLRLEVTKPSPILAVRRFFNALGLLA